MIRIQRTTRAVLEMPMKEFYVGYPRNVLLALCVLLISMTGMDQVFAATRVFNVQSARPIAEFAVTLSPISGSHTIELRNFAQEANPVVHLLSSSMTQIGSAVPSNGQLILSVAGSLSGSFLIVVRSQSATSPQGGELWIDGQLNTSQVVFTSGEIFRMDRLASDEKVMGIRPPLGPVSHVAYLVTIDGLTIFKRGAGNHTSVSPPSTQDVLAIYASRSPSVTGPLRVYRNDAGHDSDGDGLGDELEAALGTCASNTGSVVGANCNEIADPRDTDGDGLQDGWEVLGKNYEYKQGNATVRGHLALPNWGADPRHKDIFIEVDFRRLNIIENQESLALHMLPETARQLAAIYGDAATTDFWLRAAHAVSVDNPDRQPGISLHLDTGVPPERPEDATIYGDWGGYNPVNAIPDPNDPGWSPSKHVRLLADINNDGNADIVGFGFNGVLTARSTGDGGFAPAKFVLANFGANHGWDPSQHVRLLADINNDGNADIVGFGFDGVWTALSTGDGNFAPAKFVLADFGANNGWDPSQHVRLLADINNDGNADIVGFGFDGVWTALSTGDGNFAPAMFVLANFGANNGWDPSQHIRLLADINNDGNADIVGFGFDGVWTALSTGDGNFAPAMFVLANFGANNGWDPSQHVRLLADINNDGNADIVGFGFDGVWTALSTGDGNFAPAKFVLADFGADNGWDPSQHVRLLADINNDGNADIVGFGFEGVWTALSTGDGNFEPAKFVLANFGVNNGRDPSQHVRLLADINNDGKADIVGFGFDGVWTALSTGDGGFAPAKFVLADFGGAKYIPQVPEQVWQQQMSPGRRGIFHYVMGYTSGGGSCGGGIACGFNMAAAGNAAHEFGHTIGLQP